MYKNFLRILVCPLDWGMGHATRCVPIIRLLLEQGHEVIIAADGAALKFLKEDFPDLEFIRFPGARITYPAGNNMVIKMIFQSPGILLNIWREHFVLKKIIKETRANVVLSDNRFGLWSKKIYSVYMTHQVMIKAPGKWKWMEPFLYRMHRWFIKHYNECWVPDLPEEINLSGDLSHKHPLPGNGHYIGLLSRFNKEVNPPVHGDPGRAPDVLIMLSGPEPQRTIFENIILEEVDRHRGIHAVVLQGLPGNRRELFPAPGVAIFNHLPDKEIARLILAARLVICRPGYSTLMDLVTLGKTALLVPTPGQTEQEYLARSLSLKGFFTTMKQKEFQLEKAMASGLSSDPKPGINHDHSLLTERINSLVEKLRT